jgi:hypothetical protein
MLLLMWVYFRAPIVLLDAAATHALSLRFGRPLAARHRGRRGARDRSTMGLGSEGAG